VAQRVKHRRMGVSTMTSKTSKKSERVAGKAAGKGVAAKSDEPRRSRPTDQANDRHDHQEGLRWFDLQR